MLLPLLLIGGFLVYQHNKTGTNKPVAPVPNKNTGQTSQPSQKYPVRAPVSARVDNTTQPWYGGSNLFKQASSVLPAGLVQKAANPNTNDVMTGFGIANQATDLWNSLDAGKWFSSSSDDSADSSDATDTESYAAVDYSGGE